MLEVHPPEHALHTWRDFSLHIATIVVGLLIAIGLEQTVEWFHHRHLVHEAHHNLRTEALVNQQKFVDDEQHLASTEAALLADLATLREREQRTEVSQGTELRAEWYWSAFESSAYDTARDTGAFTYMPYQDVQNIDSVYRQQHYVDAAVAEYIRSMYRIRQQLAGNRTLSSATRPELESMIASCSAALISLDLLRDLMRDLGTEYRQLASEPE